MKKLLIGITLLTSISSYAIDRSLPENYSVEFGIGACDKEYVEGVANTVFWGTPTLECIRKDTLGERYTTHLEDGNSCIDGYTEGTAESKYMNYHVLNCLSKEDLKLQYYVNFRSKCATGYQRDQGMHFLVAQVGAYESFLCTNTQSEAECANLAELHGFETTIVAECLVDWNMNSINNEKNMVLKKLLNLYNGNVEVSNHIKEYLNKNYSKE